MAAIAVTMTEMGQSQSDVWAAIVGMMVRLHETDTTLLRNAADSISRLPQPPDESAADLERLEKVRAMLGVPSATDKLAASLRAREWLQRLAVELDDRLAAEE